MLETDLISFYEGKTPDWKYNIYVLKSGDTIIYVGRSADIWNRWFGEFGRLRKTPKWFRGYGDSVSCIICRNPSWDWKIQLWTVREAARYCRYKIPNRPPSARTIDRIETEMIIKLGPIENVSKASADSNKPIPDYIQAYYIREANAIDLDYDKVFNKS